VNQKKIKTEVKSMKVLYCAMAVLIVLSTILVSACGNKTSTTTATTTKATTAPPATTSAATTSATTAQVTTTKPTTAPATTTPVQTSTSTTAAKPDKYGGTWKTALYAGPASPIGYPPESANDAFSAAGPCLESMYKVQADGKLTPKLATSWDIDTAASTIVFRLRKNVKFHDGSDFNASVVKWCWDLEGAARRTPNIKSIDVIDDYTLRVNCLVLRNTDITAFDGGQYGIFSKASFDKNGLDYTRARPIGTGPFLFEQYVKDSKITYTRNPNYWDPVLPYVNRLEMSVVAEETVRKLLFERGDIHQFAPSSQLAPEMLQTKKYDVMSSIGGTYGLVPDSANADSPLSKLKVRQAVSYALDRESLCSGVGRGILQPAYQIYPGNQISALPEGSYLKTEYNVTKAKQLLTEAGYPNGFKTGIHTFTQAVNKDYITYIVNLLAAVNITVEADFPDGGKYQEYRTKGWTNSLLAHGFANLGVNPNGIASWYLPENNVTFPSLKRPDGFYTALNASLATPVVDPVKVKAAYKYLADDFTIICYAEDRTTTFYIKGAHDDGALIYQAPIFAPELAWLDAALRK
jgi:ABC-type transport system substrate-binding protein